VARPRPLFLIGFMAAGKTSVGRRLAESTGRAFVDLDDAIAEMGEAVATLVSRDEAEFRRREATALAKLIEHAHDAVIATGGGAAAYGDNLARMRAAGLVIALGVEADEARRRAQGGPDRPLIANAEQLAAARAPVYRRAHAVIDTTGRTIDEVVGAIREVERSAARLPAGTHATYIALGDRTYPITLSDGPPASDLVRAALGSASRIAVITDSNVAAHHGSTALSLASVPLSAATGAAELVVELPPGESSKSFATYERVCNHLIAAGLDRGSAIVAFGGGVVGDLAGFVAATLFRGIPVVQVPTTLVAMTDAAIGGKTAIDVPAGKNLVGAFHQPRLVACHTPVLATLPARERRAGFGELWKYALLDGAELWRGVSACAAWAAGPDSAVPPHELREVIERSIAYKAAIVSRDERERTGHRALLNLGHTVGHAIESASEGALLHGEAVGLGLIAACRISAALGYAGADLESEVTAGLAASGLPCDLSPWLRDDVLARIQVDKKRIGAKLTFLVSRGVGACEPVEIDVTEVRRILRPSTAT
jgi:shikimate kinase/3-dehydroquinate synthase